jgi:dihydroorotase
MTLFAKDRPAADLVIRGARVLDPVEGVDATLDVRIDGGTIVALAPQVEANDHRVVDGAGLVLAPAFVDPHVHLRTPGREDEETIASGTAAAAAGGYCAILAMPNTDPVVDSAATLGALVETARREAEIPVGFLAAITRGQRGEELTEMAELADAGAVAFSDDGVPVASAGLMRRALQYASITGRLLALHCEELTLSRGGHVHEGRVAAELGFAGYPSVAESVAVERDLALAAYEAQPVHVLHLSAAESVAALRRARAAGVAASGEATPHHLCLTDEAVRSLDANLKMNPPLRSADDRAALIEALRDGTIEAVATDHAPHAAHEKEVPFEAAPFGVTGLETAFAALYTHLVVPGLIPLETLLERMSAGPARIYGLERPRLAVGAPADLVLLDLVSEWRVGEEPFRSRSRNSWLLGQSLTGRIALTVAEGAVVFEHGLDEAREGAKAGTAAAPEPAR